MTDLPDFLRPSSEGALIIDGKIAAAAVVEESRRAQLGAALGGDGVGDHEEPVALPALDLMGGQLHGPALNGPSRRRRP